MKLLGLALVLLGIVFVAGCDSPPNPHRFNDKLAEFNRKLAKSVIPLRYSLAPLKQKAMPKMEEVRRQYNAARTALSQVKDDVDKLKPPRRSGYGGSLLENYKSYLAAQEKILADVASIIKVLEDNDIADMEEKLKVINTLNGDIAMEEAKGLKQLRDLQKSFADEHNLKVVYTRSGLER